MQQRQREQGCGAEQSGGQRLVPRGQSRRDDLGDQQQHHEFERRKLAQFALAHHTQGQRQQNENKGDANDDFHLRPFGSREDQRLNFDLPASVG